MQVKVGQQNPMTFDNGYNSLYLHSLSYIIALVVNLINSVVTYVIRLLSRWQAHSTYSGDIHSETSKLICLYLINTIAIPILAARQASENAFIWCVLAEALHLPTLSLKGLPVAGATRATANESCTNESLFVQPWRLRLINGLYV
jgi:hypothetical protein